MSAVHYGRCLTALQRFEEAEEVLVTVYERHKALNGADREETRSALAALLDLYEAWGKPERAAEYRGRYEGARPAASE